MPPPINPNSRMSLVVAACKEPRTIEQIAQALGTDVVTARQTVQNLISRRRLRNIGNRRGGHGAAGVFVAGSARDVFQELESAWRQAA